MAHEVKSLNPQQLGNSKKKYFSRLFTFIYVQLRQQVWFCLCFT